MTPRAVRAALAMGLALAPWPAFAQQAAPATAKLDRQTGVEQLSTSRVMRRAIERATNEGAAPAGPSSTDAQIALSRRNVSAPGAISEASDSRGSVPMVVGGSDRCDPAQKSADRESCASVIENRASEFAHKDAPSISPESTLLAASQRAGLGQSATSQAGTIAPTDAEQRGNQELATVVLNQQAQQQATSGNTSNQPSLDANQQAIVNAVVQSLTRGN